MKYRFILVLVLLLSTVNVCAQSDRASITGTVRDTSAAVIENAQVTVANGATSCENPPGVREGAGGKLYLAYLRDPDGNKICAMHRMG